MAELLAEGVESPRSRGSAGLALIAFDVDGTLYDQRRLRKRMAFELLRELAWSKQGLRKIRIIREFRKVRERLAELQAEGVSIKQYSETAQRLGVSADEVCDVTEEWIDRRPLAHLAACREPGVRETFELVRRRGICLGIFSDYPAKAKLNSLGLGADLVVSATDANVDRFKPHPRGLQVLMAAAHSTPEQSVLVGDRDERDGRCARECGVRYWHKGARAVQGRDDFVHFSELTDWIAGQHERPEHEASR